MHWTILCVLAPYGVTVALVYHYTNLTNNLWLCFICQLPCEQYIFLVTDRIHNMQTCIFGLYQEENGNRADMPIRCLPRHVPQYSSIDIFFIPFSLIHMHVHPKVRCGNRSTLIQHSLLHLCRHSNPDKVNYETCFQ